MLIVDGNNVMGAIADGWWRDRPAAARRLLDRLQGYARSTRSPVVLMLDVPQPDLPAGNHDGVDVHYPDRRGRDAADDAIVQLLHAVDGEPVEVVTSDWRLAEEARQLGASVVGARTFLTRIETAGC